MPGIYRDPKMLNAAGQPAFVVWFYDVDGKTRKRFRTDALKRSEAVPVLASFIRKVNEARERGLSTYEAAEPLSFSKFYEGAYSDWSGAKNRESTQKRKGVSYGNLKGFFGSKLLPTISSKDVEQYVVQRLGGKLSDGKVPRPGTVNRERSLLSNVLNRAMVQGLIQRNPVVAVEALHEDNENGRPVSPEEEAAILKDCPKWLRELFLVGIHTGMRSSEIRTLQWADVDLKKRFIYVRTTKTHKPRNVPLNDVALGVLQPRAPFPGQKVEKPYVFGNPETDKPYNVTSVSHAFRRACDSIEDADLGEVTFHSSRHTFYSRMIDAGVPERKVMAITGHRTPSMANRYCHLGGDGLAGTTEVLAPKKADIKGSSVQVPYEKPEKAVASANH
jgi:integrase